MNKKKTTCLLDVKFVCEPKENMSVTFCEYGDYKLNVNCNMWTPAHIILK